jgi:hypothetical protein
MVTYMPVLKGRQGEFSAVAQLASAAVRRVLPIFEVPPSGQGPIKDAYNFAVRVRDSLPADLSIAVDVRYLSDPTDGPRRPLRDVADDLAAFDIPMLPVAHLDDHKGRMRDVAYAAEVHSGNAVLRLGDDTSDPDDIDAEERLGRLDNLAGLATEQCHLVLDVFELRSERDVSRVEPVVRKCVSWAQRYTWRSITVAGGAMPESISNLPTGVPTPVRRLDMSLWRRLQELGLGYADYGIAHPRMTGQGWPPMPSLRYTNDEVWWIYRWPQDKLAAPAMFDLCKALVAADHWTAKGPDFSWGDQQIAARAARNGGPGNATNWRAWATSHHIAHVLDQMTRDGPAA